jgi:hypothetical protein
MVDSDTARLAFRQVPACHLSSTSTPISLDFDPHRQEEEPSSNASSSQIQYLPMFEPCDMKYSEYTPCEDPERSKKSSPTIETLNNSLGCMFVSVLELVLECYGCQTCDLLLQLTLLSEI